MTVLYVTVELYKRRSVAAAIMLCAWNVAVIQLRLIFIQKKKGWMPPKGQLCFGTREKLFQAVRENDFHTVK